MIKICSFLLIFLQLISGSVGAGEAMSDWKNSTTIEITGTNKYKAIFLPNAVYASALPSLADLRIMDAKGNQVPFYIQSGAKTFAESETIYSATVIETFIKDNHTYIDCRIQPKKQDSDMDANALRFELPSNNFLKHLQIYGSHDGTNWELIIKDYVFKEGNNKKDEVSFSKKRKFQYYRVIILDNTEKISLSKITLVNHFANVEWNNYLKVINLPFEMTTEKKESFLKLHNDSRLPIRKIILDASGDFQRHYAVFNDKISRNPLKTGEIYNLQLESTNISDSSICLSETPTTSALLLLKIYNRDDQPLVLNSVSVEYYVDKIVFPDNGTAPYTLYFGNTNATSPNYEIRLQKEYIERESQDVCALSTPNNNEKATSTFNDIDTKSIFNIIIVAVSILLIGLLALKLNNKKE